MHDKKIELNQISDILEKKKSIPREYFSDILEMCEYNKYNRYTDPIEQILMNYVIYVLVGELIDEEMGVCENV